MKERRWQDMPAELGPLGEMIVHHCQLCGVAFWGAGGGGRLVTMCPKCEREFYATVAR